MALLFFATTINYIDRQVIGILKPFIAGDLGWNEADYGYIVTAFQLAYAIGVSKPLAIYADCHGTEQVDIARLEKTLPEVMDLSPRGIREHLHLNRPIYARTAAYGHFGRAPDADGGFSWEKRDLVDALKSQLA